MSILERKISRRGFIAGSVATAASAIILPPTVEENAGFFRKFFLFGNVVKAQPSQKFDNFAMADEYAMNYHQIPSAMRGDATYNFPQSFPEHVADWEDRLFRVDRAAVRRMSILPHRQEELASYLGRNAMDQWPYETFMVGDVGTSLRAGEQIKIGHDRYTIVGTHGYVVEVTRNMEQPGETARGI